MFIGSLYSFSLGLVSFTPLLAYTWVVFFLFLSLFVFISFCVPYTPFYSVPICPVAILIALCCWLCYLCHSQYRLSIFAFIYFNGRIVGLPRWLWICFHSLFSCRFCSRDKYSVNGRLIELLSWMMNVDMSPFICNIYMCVFVCAFVVYCILFYFMRVCFVCCLYCVYILLQFQLLPCSKYFYA